MKIWTEVRKDAYANFDWFSREKASSLYGFVPELTVFSINCERCYQEVNEFKQKCVKIISALNCNFFLFSVRGVDTKSRVANYFKLWKETGRQWDLSGFNLGVELIENINEKNYYYGLSQIDRKSINKVIDMLMSNPSRYLFFASSREIELNDKQFATEMFNLTCNNSEVVDLFNATLFLSIKLKDVVVFRYGDSSEDKEVSCITNTRSDEIQKIFKAV